MNQYGLKTSDPAFQRGASHQVTPDEVDRYEIYNVIKPGAGTAAVGTVAAGTGTSGSLTLVANDLDYPRNLLVSPSGATSTVVATGVNQFGEPVSETMSAASGATDAGTAIFSRVDSVTYTKSSTAGTIHLGVASGTAADSPLLGLPFKIGGTADVKRALWIDNGTTKQLSVGGAAPSLIVNTDTHSVRVHVAGGIAAADDFVIWAKPTYDASNDSQPQAGL